MEILISDKINKDHLGIFANSYCLSNYEYSFKTVVDEEKDDSELKNTTSIILISDKAQKAKIELQKGKPKKKTILTELITESGWKEFGEPILKNWKKEFKFETMPLKSDRIMTELDVFEKFFDDTFFEHLKE